MPFERREISFESIRRFTNTPIIPVIRFKMENARGRFLRVPIFQNTPSRKRAPASVRLEDRYSTPIGWPRGEKFRDEIFKYFWLFTAWGVCTVSIQLFFIVHVSEPIEFYENCRLPYAILICIIILSHINRNLIFNFSI